MQRRSSSEYTPAEDTFFVAENIQDERGDAALDIGSGSGYLTKLLQENFRLVVGTDVNFEVLRGQTYKTDSLVCCNGSDALWPGFDLVVCNMPYLATDGILDISTDGGAGGFEVPRRILDSACSNIKNTGRFVFVTSSLSDHERLMGHAQGLGLECRIVARKKLFFEELLLVESRWPAGLSA